MKFLSPFKLSDFAKTLSLFLSISLGTSTAVTACKWTSGSQESAVNSMVAPGALEYTITGRDYIKLDPEWAKANPDPQKRRQEAERLASLRRMADGIFLNNYLNDKEDGDGNFGYGGFNAEIRFSKDINPNLELDKKDPTQTKYWFDYSFVVGGYEGLVGMIKNDAYQKDKQSLGPNQFVYASAVLDNETMAQTRPGKEWFRSDDWGFWSPTNNPAKAVVYNLTVNIIPKPKEPDAYIPVDQLVVTGADGSMSIPMAVHFGWDGESQGADIPKGGVRYDIELARRLFKKLQKLGFKPPTAQFETYQPFDPKTPPFKKVIQFRGKPLTVEVSVYTAGQTKAMEPEDDSKPAFSLVTTQVTPFQPLPGPDPETAAGAKVAREQMLHSLKHKKVIMYLGHSGLGMGFNFGDWFVPEVDDKGTVFASALAKAPLMDSYQLVVADGCQTYYLAENFLQNPTKRDPTNSSRLRNLNLITSLGFTDADSTRTVTQLLKLLSRQEQGHWVAPRVSDLLTRYNPDGVPFQKYMKIGVKNVAANDSDDDDDDDDPLFPVYGMHGVEGNPRSNPLADRDAFGKACVNATYCGTGDGNICHSLQDQIFNANSPKDSLKKSPAGSCTLQCINDSGCAGLRGGQAVCSLPPLAKGGAAQPGICLPRSKVEVY